MATLQEVAFIKTPEPSLVFHIGPALIRQLVQNLFVFHAAQVLGADGGFRKQQVALFGRQELKRISRLVLCFFSFRGSKQMYRPLASLAWQELFGNVPLFILSGHLFSDVWR